MTKWEEFVPALDAGCMALTPFCDEKEWEEAAKKRSKVRIADPSHHR